MSNIVKISAKIFRFFRMFLITLGTFFLLFLLLGFTSIPFWAKYRLAQYEAYVTKNINTIVVMGANGFPSEALLMRLWYTNDLAQKFPQTKLVITTPGNISDSTSTIFLMQHYFLERGIDSARIILENEGLNTRHQALMVKKMHNEMLFEEPIIIVSSPSHMYRSIKCFQKVGFNKLSGQPAIGIELETDLRIRKGKLGGNGFVPDAGRSISIRYKYWEYLKLEIDVAREYVAITYYKLKGWI